MKKKKKEKKHVKCIRKLLEELNAEKHRSWHLESSSSSEEMRGFFRGRADAYDRAFNAVSELKVYEKC